MRNLYNTVMESLKSEDNVTVQIYFANHIWAVSITAWYFDTKEQIPLLGEYSAADDDLLQAIVQALQRVSMRRQWRPGDYIDMGKVTKPELEAAGIEWEIYWKHACAKHKISFKRGNCPSCTKGEAWVSKYGDTAGCVLCADLDIEAVLVRKFNFADGEIGFDHKAYCKKHYDFIESSNTYDKETTSWYSFEAWTNTFSQQALHGME